MLICTLNSCGRCIDAKMVFSTCGTLKKLPSSSGSMCGRLAWAAWLDSGAVIQCQEHDNSVLYLLFLVPGFIGESQTKCKSFIQPPLVWECVELFTIISPILIWSQRYTFPNIRPIIYCADITHASWLLSLVSIQLTVSSLSASLIYYEITTRAIQLKSCSTGSEWTSSEWTSSAAFSRSRIHTTSHSTLTHSY